jgi:hypothetical protein
MMLPESEMVFDGWPEWIPPREHNSTGVWTGMSKGGSPEYPRQRQPSTDSTKRAAAPGAIRLLIAGQHPQLQKPYRQYCPRAFSVDLAT